MKKTDEREERFRRLLEATAVNTIAGDIDVATKHYLAELEAKRRIVDELPDRFVDDLSTPYIPLRREISTRVGRAESD